MAEFRENEMTRIENLLRLQEEAIDAMFDQHTSYGVQAWIGVRLVFELRKSEPDPVTIDLLCDEMLKTLAPGDQADARFHAAFKAMVDMRAGKS